MLLPPVGGFSATATSGGVVFAIAMASTFLLPGGSPRSFLWKVRPPSVERKKSPPVLPPASAPAYASVGSSGPYCATVRVSPAGAPVAAVHVAPPSPLRKRPCEVATSSGRMGTATSITPEVIDPTTAPDGSPESRTSQAEPPALVNTYPVVRFPLSAPAMTVNVGEFAATATAAME